MRVRGMPLLAASQRRWLRAVRPGCSARASSSAPTSRSGAADSAYERPFTVTLPAVGRSSPSTMRIVVDLPAPFGPRKPVTRPGSTAKLRPVDGDLGAVGLGESAGDDHRDVRGRWGGVVSMSESLSADGCPGHRGPP